MYHSSGSIFDNIDFTKIYEGSLNLEPLPYPYVRSYPIYVNGMDMSSSIDCTGISKKVIMEDKMKTEEPKSKSIFISRDDKNDRAIVSLAALEPKDVFRLVFDPEKKVYIVVDTTKCIDSDTVDNDFIYAFDVADAELVALDKSEQAYVYTHDACYFKTGSFITEDRV